MTTLPQNIEEIFYKTIIGEISIDDFEQWLYANRELEKILNSDDYLDLISLSFKKSGSKYELSKLLKKHINLGEFETYRLLGLLNEAKQKNERLPYILMEFYDLYCKGYDFLQDLGIGAGLSVVVPRVNNSTADSWDELTNEQQEELLNELSPELEACLEQVIYWLETKKIILTGEQNEYGHYDYKDLTTEEERHPKLWVPPLEEQASSSISRSTLWHKASGKKWWEFWK